jgi:hypothetical protein
LPYVITTVVVIAGAAIKRRGRKKHQP